MPQKGLSWSRLKEHFRKCLPIYIIGVVVCLLLTNIVYTSTRPQTPSEREVLVYLLDAYSNPDPLDAVAAEGLAEGQAKDETLEEVRFESIPFNDPEQDYTSMYVLMARMSVGDGDAYLASSAAIDYLTNSGICLPLDDALAQGWMDGCGLEPLSYTDEETGETYTAALSLDDVDALAELGAFYNDGAYLVIAVNGANVDTSMQVVETMIRRLREGVEIDETANPEEPAA